VKNKQNAYKGLEWDYVRKFAAEGMKNYINYINFFRFTNSLMMNKLGRNV
jgi:hypothetical protein